jgi:hypothetical protein
MVPATQVDTRIQYESRTQYQAVASPVFANDIITQKLESRWHYPWSEPVRQKLGLPASRQQALAWSTFTPTTVVVTAQTVPVSPVDVRVQYESRTQYQAQAYPIFFATTETVTVDKWVYPWREPVRQKPGLQTALQQSHAGPVLPQPAAVTVFTETVSSEVQFPKWIIYQTDTRPLVFAETVTVDKWVYPWSAPVRAKPGLAAQLQQFLAAPPFEDTQEPGATYESPWHQPWAEPVRQKPGLSAQLQQFFTEVLEPNTQIIQGFESRWHYAWSEPVRVRQLATAQQSTTVLGVPSFETVTVDKWVYPWSDPVRSKPGLAASLQQFLAAPPFEDTQEPGATNESPWHYPWSEPVRQRAGLPAQLQQFIAGPSFENTLEPGATYESPWHQPWSEPVRTRQLAVAQQQSLAFQLEPNTQIIQGFESRWHYAWSEPVRVRQLPTAEQSTTVLGVPSFEVVTVDKWIYPWIDPVRSKSGLGAALQQFIAQTVLEPNTQIIQGFESRWHYAWSEPVRVKPQVPAAQQQAYAAPVSVTETITVDKWVYPWRDPVKVKPQLPVSQQQFLAADTAVIPTSNLEPWFAPLSDPVRQKPGLGPHLQQSLIATTLEPNTQIIQGFESRWHYAWSEPVRTRQLATAQQQSHTEPPTSVFEVVTIDKWFAPFREPVRDKIGLKASLQQAFIAPVLNPETQIIQGFESRWHQPWSEPNVKYRRPAAWYQPFTADTLVIPTSKQQWFAPWREPVWPKSGLHASRQQFFAADTQTIPRSKLESLWHQGWSEPARKKPGIGAWLQSTTSLATPPFPTFLKQVEWLSPFSEPVRQKRGLGAWLQQIWTISPFPATTITTLTLSATEVNTDSALFSVIVYNQASTAVVSVREIPSVRAAVASTREIQAVRAAAASTVEEPSIDASAISVVELFVIQPPPGVKAAYITEDGITFYVAANGSLYIPEP